MTTVDAPGRQQSLKEQLVGTWTLLSWEHLVAITGDLLTLTVRLPGGEVVDVVWKRAK
jgi:hypothetical protein